jgi:hypothetical protein
MIISLAAVAADIRAGKREFSNNWIGPHALRPLNHEQLRKQAKELLDAWQTGDAASLARVAVHPDAAGLQHRSPQLADAQHVLAIEHGFYSWGTLKRFVEMQTVARDAQTSGDGGAPDSGKRTLHISREHIPTLLAVAGLTGDWLYLPMPRDEVPLAGLPHPQQLEQFFEAYHPLDRATGSPSMRWRGANPDDVFDGWYRDDKGRFAALAKAHSYERVCLWCGPGDPDFKFLAFLLVYFDQPEHRPQSLELVSLRRFPGVNQLMSYWQLPPGSIRHAATWFRPIRADQYATGQAVWQALTAASPMPMWQLQQGDMLEPLSWQSEARRMLDQLPSVHDGLGGPERQLLLGLAGGEEVGSDALNSMKRRANSPNYGGWRWDIVAHRLASGREPAVTMRLDDGPNPGASMWLRQWWFQITDVGRELLAGKRHWMELATEPYWVGGVEIDPAKTHWCWDHKSQKPVLRQV